VNINTTTFSFVPLLEGLEAEDLAYLVPKMEQRTYAKGETLFAQGDPGGALMIVVSGKVELYIFDARGSRIVLSQVSAGGFFGEVSLFDNGERTTNAIAVEPTEVVILRQEVMVDYLRKHPDAAIHVIAVLSKRLRDNVTLLSTSEDRRAYEVFQEKATVLERVADRAAAVVGSWPYLTFLVIGILAWMVVNLAAWFGVWDAPYQFNILNLILTVIGVLQVPFILMAQKRQDTVGRISADLQYDVNLRAQLSILDVIERLDWLRESMLQQTARLERLEKDQYEEQSRPTIIHKD